MISILSSFSGEFGHSMKPFPEGSSYQTIEKFLSKTFAALNEYENKDFLIQFEKGINGSVEFDLILDDP